MTLLRSSSGSKPQRGEDRIGGGQFGLLLDPLLDPGQAFGGLVDVVAIGDVDKGFEQLFKTLVAGAVWRRCSEGGSASRRAHDRPQFFDPSHSPAFPRSIPADVQSPHAVA
jgi:hypothetical protein